MLIKARTLLFQYCYIIFQVFDCYYFTSSTDVSRKLPSLWLSILGVVHSSTCSWQALCSHEVASTRGRHAKESSPIHRKNELTQHLLHQFLVSSEEFHCIFMMCQHCSPVTQILFSIPCAVILLIVLVYLRDLWNFFLFLRRPKFFL